MRVGREPLMVLLIEPSCTPLRPRRNYASFERRYADSANEHLHRIHRTIAFIRARSTATPIIEQLRFR